MYSSLGLVVLIVLLAACLILFMYLDIKVQKGMSERERAIHNGG